MADFDMVLVYTSLRRHGEYLNILKAMGKNYRIGILMLDPSSTTGKTALSENEFLKYCYAYGGIPVEGSCHTKLFVVPRLPSQWIVLAQKRVEGSITYDKLVQLGGGPFAGAHKHLELVAALGKATLLIQDRARFGLNEQNDSLGEMAQTGADLIEVGSPYQKHPIFPEFQADYLIAYPSSVSVAHYRQLYWLLHNIVSVIDSLPAGAVIYTKPHNARDEGNYLSDPGRYGKWKLNRSLARLFLRAFHWVSTRRLGARIVYDFIPLRLLREINPLQNAYILQNSRNLLNEYPAFGIEQFIAGVRKGIVTGLSTTIWEALHSKIPVYNVDALPIETRPSNYQVLYQSYGIDQWNGFTTDVAFSKVADSTRRGDLIETLKSLIAG